jgi:hypothetical protein
MSRRGSWTRRAALPPHVIASQQRRGQQLAARQRWRRGKDLIPQARQPAEQARDSHEGEDTGNL